MGWETLAFVGLNAVKGAVAVSNANKAAKATIQEGDIAEANKAKDIARQAGALTNSFLSSGLTLEGTPKSSIDSIYDTGVDDLNQISTNYNNKAKSQIAAGRTSAIEDLASGFGEAAFGGGSSSIDAPAFGDGSYVDMKLNSFGGTDLGESMPWLNAPAAVTTRRPLSAGSYEFPNSGYIE